MELARSLLVLGRIERRRKARKQARDALGRAQELAAQTGRLPAAETHVASIYRKLGVRTRAELAANYPRRRPEGGPDCFGQISAGRRLCSSTDTGTPARPAVPANIRASSGFALVLLSVASMTGRRDPPPPPS